MQECRRRERAACGKRMLEVAEVAEVGEGRPSACDDGTNSEMVVIANVRGSRSYFCPPLPLDLANSLEP